MKANEGKRKRLVWEIETKLADDGARPIIFYNRFAYCWRPQVKDWTMMVNSIINNCAWKTPGSTNSRLPQKGAQPRSNVDIEPLFRLDDS